MRNCKQPSCFTSNKGNHGESVCGTNIDLDDIRFTRPQENLVYMDKVFSLNNGVSCPILHTLNTAGANQRNFIVTLTTTPRRRSCGCGCGCENNACALDSSSVFRVRNSRVVTEAFTVASGSSINPNQVTVDGFPVDSVRQFGNEFIATTQNLLSNISKRKCMEQGKPTKGLLLLNNIGPWFLRMKIILEGTVNTNGQTCDFCAEIATAPQSPIRIPSTSNFAVPHVSLPCTMEGISPTIRFQFNSCVALQNPILTAAASGDGCGCGCETVSCGAGCSNPSSAPITLRTTLVVEPTINVEVVRQSLFKVQAQEECGCCDDLVPEDHCEDSRCDRDRDCYRCQCSCGSCSCGCGCGCECGCNQCECHKDCGKCSCESENDCERNRCGCENEREHSCECDRDSCECENRRDNCEDDHRGHRSCDHECDAAGACCGSNMVRSCSNTPAAAITPFLGYGCVRF